MFQTIINIKRKINFSIKKLLPDTFLIRVLVMVATVLFITQLVLIIVFYDNLWRQVRTALVKHTATDISYITYLHNNNLENTTEYTLFTKLVSMSPRIMVNPEEINSLKNNIISKNVEMLYDQLSKIIGHDNIYIHEYGDNYSINQVLIKLDNGNILSLYINKSSIYSTSIEVIIGIMILSYLGGLILLIQLFKNQVRPLKNLSKAAKAFGKGENVKYLNPTGSIEIREATIAFNEMKDRIKGFVENRTLMLSGISHDLKTSLTKMNLILDLFAKENKELYSNMKPELDSMQDMLKSYLLFSQEYNELIKKQDLNIQQFFTKIIKYYKKDLDITVSYKQSSKILNADHTSIKRVMENLLNNCIKYASVIHITIEDQGYHSIKITIEDNGKGIPEESYNDVFKPFYKLNEARTPEKGSVGLGLSIVKDLISQHGGNISLGKSEKLGGLSISITIPY